MIRKSTGSSLIETMISVGILSITVVAFATLTTNQQKNNRALSEKIAALDLSNVLIRTIANNSVCSFFLTNPNPAVFDSTKIGSNSPPSIPFTKIYGSPSAATSPIVEVGKTASALSPGAVVSSIAVDNISGAGDIYSAKVTVLFDPVTLVQQLRPVQVGINFVTDPTSPATAKRVLSCGSSGGNIELIWSGSVGGGGGRTYGNQSLIAGKKFSDYAWIFVLGAASNIAANQNIG
jgi:type II secretory pathway pseudopilin PulG